jgi:heme oxygenase
MLNMNDVQVKLDRNYNFFEKTEDPYKDTFGEVFDLVEKATREQLISEQDASFILNLAIRRELKNDVVSVFKNQQPEKLTMFLQLKNTHQLNHA